MKPETKALIWDVVLPAAALLAVLGLLWAVWRPR